MAGALVIHPTSGECLYSFARDGPLPSTPVHFILRVMCGRSCEFTSSAVTFNADICLVRGDLSSKESQKIVKVGKGSTLGCRAKRIIGEEAWYEVEVKGETVHASGSSVVETQDDAEELHAAGSTELEDGVKLDILEQLASAACQFAPRAFLPHWLAALCCGLALDNSAQVCRAVFVMLLVRPCF
jgi:hypothetical protein